MIRLSTSQKIFFNTLLILAYFLVGIVFYSIEEDWSALDSLYFSVVTISTVGYGDLAPSTDASRIFTIFYMLFGIYIIFYTLYHYVNRGVKKMRKVLRERHFSTASISSHLPQFLLNNNSSQPAFGRSNTTTGGELPGTGRNLFGSHNNLMGLAETDHNPRRNTFDFFGSSQQHHEEEKNEYAAAISTTTAKYNERKKRVHIATLALLGVILLGAMFLCLNEDWSFVTALFFAVETSTTVGYGDERIKYNSTKGFLIAYILVSATIVVYILNTLHSMQKSYTEVKKRRKALQQKKSFEESWHELQKMIASMSQHHQHHPTLSSHQPSFSGSLHGMLPTISALHGGPPRTFTHFSMTEEAADDHLYLYGNRNMSTDSTTTTAMNLTRINEFQFVIFILRHLQIIDDKKHIQPWIKKFRDLDKDRRGFLTIDQLRDFCKVDAAKTEEEIQHIDEVLHPTNTVLTAIAGSKNNSRKNSRSTSKDTPPLGNLVLTKGISMEDLKNPLQQQLLSQDVFVSKVVRDVEEDEQMLMQPSQQPNPTDEEDEDEDEEDEGGDSSDEEDEEEEE